ncbi:hypothetical protein DFJ67_3939 [Asanoa ferruginea]|jgi:hypothetical protein|uniref:Uncharacterized protein n=1 Tax=Asanoa ferruginea TaxID=53367 RepID=A0A3D9ZW81_9ACTN|nr:hypothetical protein [Asanoa ferruginea]REF97930.1 hypothetical protein DFJ67_3939 [Asanoa ferruginea]GIF50044.1 hypothetical protein Afe04nite_45830 [Asanoa ferruginea]
MYENPQLLLNLANDRQRTMRQAAARRHLAVRVARAMRRDHDDGGRQHR